MIEAKDLRIGNILSFNSGKYCRVFAIQEDSIGVEDEIDPTYENLCNLHYVELTEDILLKIGFTIEEDYLEYEINDSLAIIWVGYLALNINGYLTFLDNQIYLHELQNIYNSLTKQELQINL